MSRRILITGSRDWTDEKIIHDVLEEELAATGEGEYLVIVHGGARGADSIAGEWAYDKMVRLRPVRYESYRANWADYGKKAGILRNELMVSYGAEVCHAFPLEGSVGTRHCMKAAEKAGIPVIDHGDTGGEG